MTDIYFDHCADHVLSVEAGLIDDPDDPGGITNHGISLRFLQGIEHNATRQNIIDMGERRARALFKRYFWDRMAGGSLPGPLALVVFDGAVNQGTRTVVKMLQRELNVTPDGRFGQKSLAALQNRQTLDVIIGFMSRRAKRYGKTSNFEKYGRGWHRRLFVMFHQANLMLEGDKF